MDGIIFYTIFILLLLDIQNQKISKLIRCIVQSAVLNINRIFLLHFDIIMSACQLVN